MKLAQYWIRQPGEAISPDGSRVRVVSRGWSDQSLEQAAAVAREVAQRVAHRIANGDTKTQRYLYGDRPLPEPIVREFSHISGPLAVITRNMYGALVMNAQEMMFVDIDRQDTAATSLIQRVAESNSLAVRIYQTAAGYRALITNMSFQPGSSQSENLLRQFGSDPLYVRLCQMQQSFRARLTPKPWRCGTPVPPVSFPFETSGEQAQFRAWDTRYQAASQRYATCRYVTSVGGFKMLPEFEDLIYEHDQQTKASSQLPLA